MNQDLYEVLKRTARVKGVLTYSEAGAPLNLSMRRPPDRNILAGLLNEICEYEVSQNRPMLSALVVLKHRKHMPSKGFFVFARSLGKLAGDDTIAERQFWEKEKAEVYNCWST